MEKLIIILCSLQVLPIFGISFQDKYICKAADGSSLETRLRASKAELIIGELMEICNQHSKCKSTNAKIDDQNKLFCSVLTSEPYNQQNTLNAIVDYVISSVVTIFAEEGRTMRLPDINRNYKLAGSTGDFQALNATFTDLRVLHRATDVVFTSEKDGLTVGTSFRIAKAKLTFPEYRLRYGYIRTSGRVGVDIDGMTVSLKLAADYNASPCQVLLDDMTMNEVGSMNVDFTGLGWPLNNAVKLAIRYVVENKILGKLKDIFADNVKNFDCEMFRSSIELMNSPN